MSTTNAAITASPALEQYFGPTRVREDTFVGEPSRDWSAEYSIGYVSMSEDVANCRDRLVGDTSSAAPPVRIWGAPVYAPDMLPLNAPFGSPPAAQRDVRLRVLTGNGDSSPGSLSAIDHLNALLAFCTDERSPRVLAVADAETSPTLPPVVEAELAEFSAGLGGQCPTAEAVRIARLVSAAAVRHVQHPGITVDIDGELSFDLRLKDGRLVFAELGFDGLLDVGVYGSDGRMLEHDAQATCAYLLSVIES